MSFVSIYTIGRLNHPYDHPSSVDFFKVGNDVFAQAINSRQMIKAFPFSPHGVPIPPEAFKGKGFPVLTLTVWRNLESLHHYTYSGLHRQALRDRSKWMEPYSEKHLSYVIWWTDKLDEVSWQEAFKRYNHYIENGPTAFAFDYKHAFDDQGKVIKFK